MYLSNLQCITPEELDILINKRYETSSLESEETLKFKHCKIVLLNDIELIVGPYRIRNCKKSLFIKAKIDFNKLRTNLRFRQHRHSGCYRSHLSSYCVYCSGHPDSISGLQLAQKIRFLPRKLSNTNYHPVKIWQYLHSFELIELDTPNIIIQQDIKYIKNIIRKWKQNIKETIQLINDIYSGDHTLIHEYSHSMCEGECNCEEFHKYDLEETNEYIKMRQDEIKEMRELIKEPWTAWEFSMSKKDFIEYGS